LFSRETAAGVVAAQHFVAGLAHGVHALRLAADVPEGGVHGGRRTHHLLSTEPALPRLLVRLELVTRLAQVVWLSLALGAEVLVALIAPDSALGHVLCRLPRKHFPLVILQVVVNLPWSHIHYG
jgi:hypothetical protein